MRATMKRAAILASVGLLSTGGAASRAVDRPDATGKRWADRIFINGSVITLDDGDRVASGLAVKGGHIMRVGSASQIRQLAGPDTIVTDLEGRALLPGFVDAHSHFLGVGTSALYEADLNSPPIGAARSIDDIVRILAERAKSVPAGGTIVGRGYDDTLLIERRHPNRSDLDRASTRHRIIIRHISGHFSAANSRAIVESGVTSETADPTGGIIRRDLNGAPSGVFEEQAMALVKKGKDAVYTRSQQLAAAKHAARIYASQGVTTAQNGSTSRSSYGLLESARQAGMVPLRLVILPNFALANAASPSADVRMSIANGVVLGPVKLFADGSIQGYTGYLSEPYHRLPPAAKTGYRGYLTQSCDGLSARVQRVVKRGWQVAIHANGDAAIDCALSAMRKAKPLFSGASYRPVIIHAQMARPDQLDSMKAIGASPSFFSLHTYFWGDRHRIQFLGPERAARISPTRSSLRRGLKFTVHTDSPVVPVNQISLLWATVNRVTMAGTVLGADERIPVGAALRAMTIDVAYQYGLETDIGSLEPGKLADLIILSKNPLTTPALHLDQLKVEETIVGGKSVFQASKP